MKRGQICIIASINIKMGSREIPEIQEYTKKMLHFIICFRQSDYQRIKLKFRNEAPPLEEKALSPTEKLHSICIQTPIHLQRKVKLNR